jgi:hypothetical protein
MCCARWKRCTNLSLSLPFSLSRLSLCLSLSLSFSLFLSLVLSFSLSLCLSVVVAATAMIEDGGLLSSLLAVADLFILSLIVELNSDDNELFFHCSCFRISLFYAVRICIVMILVMKSFFFCLYFEVYF